MDGVGTVDGKSTWNSIKIGKNKEKNKKEFNI
jgi:hypothetical protein